MNGGKTVKILGWGGTIDQANATSQNMSCDLLEASMQVNIVDCVAHWLAQVDDLYNHSCPSVSKAKLCIHRQEQPPAQNCFGDSGGPLMKDENGFGVVIGVSSFIQAFKVDLTCGTDNEAVFTKVQDFLPWIQNMTLQGKSKRNLKHCLSLAVAS